MSDEFAQTLRLLIDDQFGSPSVGRDERPGWKRLVAEFGVMGLALPERCGGAGGTLADAATVLLELGRQLIGGPYLSTLIAAHTLLGTDDGGPWLAQVAAGDLALTTLGDHSVPADRTRIVASSGARGWTMSGEQPHVLNADAAGLALIWVGAEAASTVQLFALELSGEGVSVERMNSLDLTRPAYRVGLRAAAATLMAEGPQARQLLAQHRQLSLLALSAERLGAAQRCLETAVEYAQQRIQFGRKIGSFQAIKHRLANVAVTIDSADALTASAVSAAVEGRPDALPAAAMAAVSTSEVFRVAAEENIQVHGGIGFTWEHPAHLYLRRHLGTAALFGDASTNRELLMSQVLA